MGIVKGSSKACLFIGILFILNCVLCCVFAQENGNEERKLYIVYLGARQHDDPELVTESHLRMLESVFESPEAAPKSMVYTYRHGFSGFAARLTRSQANKLSDRPDVLRVVQDSKLQLHGTRMFEYLGVSPNIPKGILQDSNMGSELVIGLLDSGIWPESPAFNDEGLGPIPKHWKGECVAGQGFDPAKHCNRKLVGAKYYLDDWKEKVGTNISSDDFMSPRGYGGHGTVVTSIAASSFVPNVSFKGLGVGVMRGAAPKARVAMYKVLWDTEPFGVGCASTVRALDEAIKDGVDVLSISIGPVAAPYKPVYALGEDIELGTFHAVMKGIPVIAGAANSGPDPFTVGNVSPWMLTVGATSIDRSFQIDMTFGNNMTITGFGTYTKGEVSGELLYVEDWKKLDPLGPTSWLNGKVVLTFVEDDAETGGAHNAITKSDVIGSIVARSSDVISDFYYSEPGIHIDLEAGTKILRYISLSSSPTVKISRGRTVLGRPIPSVVARFSSRGPNAQSPAILKPDIVAPGMMVMGTGSGNLPGDPSPIMIGQGTSFSTPAVAGILLLIKAIHPDWSPAMLKSAIMTTAWKTDPSGDPMFAEGNPRKLANAFDYGAGLVNPERARDPGLVYDLNLDDYIHYFCASGYDEKKITLLTGKQTKCSSPLPSMLDFNYPAITIPDIGGAEVTATRTVTNVGPVDSVYRAVIEAPEGVKVAVEPETLVFNSSTKKLGFKVRVSTSHKSNSGYYFGSFTWTDGTRNVTIPLSVRSRVPQL